MSNVMPALVELMLEKTSVSLIMGSTLSLEHLAECLVNMPVHDLHNIGTILQPE